MTTRPPLSVVVPLYRTRAQLPELLDRLAGACPAGTELVLVDDACPEGSGRAAPPVQVGLTGHVAILDRNVGQHTAVLLGVGRASGERVAVMDADLQDRPEDLPALLAVLDRTPNDAVAAGRRGRYQSRGRRLTSRLFRQVQWLVTAGRVPADAGMFLVMRRDVASEVLALGDPYAPLVTALGVSGCRVRSVPVTRDARTEGSSAYGLTDRIAVARRAVATALPPVLRRRRLDRWEPPAVTRIELTRMP